MSRFCPFLAALLVLAFLGTGDLFADTPIEAAHRFLTLAYEGRFAELPKTSDAGTAMFERGVRNTLRVRCVRVDSVRVLDLSADETNAVANVEVLLDKVETQRADGWRVTDLVPLRVKLARDGERWLVSAIEFPDAELAEELFAAKEEDRRAILARDPQRITKSLARAMYDQALALMNKGKLEDGGRAARLARALAIAAGDRGGESLALGLAAYTNGGADPVPLIEESMAIAQSVGDPDVLARAWYNRGRITGFSYWETRRRASESGGGGTRKAREYAERAEDPGLLLRVLYSTANNAANRYLDHVTARQYVDLALPLAREYGDPNLECGLETVLSTIYFQQDDLERGLFHHERALKLAETHGLYSYATLRMRSAWALAEQGHVAEARAAFAKALFRDARGVLQTIGPAPPSHIGTALVAMARLEAEEGKLDQAGCLIREAAARFKSGATAFDYELAPYFLKRKQYAEALQVSLSSLTDAGLYPDQRMTVLALAARAYRALGDPKHAMTSILEAIEIRESINARIAGDEQQRARASDRTATLYELAAELALDGGDAARALAFLERGRAFALTDILENGRIAPDEGQQEQLRLEGDLAQLSLELERARAAGKTTVANRLSEQLRVARAEYATYVDGLHARSERQLHARRSGTADALSELQKRLEPGVVAIEYLVADEQLHLFVVDAQRVVHRRVDVERGVLEKRVDAFSEAIAARDLEVQRSARALYELLIAPVEHELARAEMLLIVPHDLLWRVPFAALADRRGRFLPERWASAYVPSLTAYSMIGSAKSARAANRTALFGIANPKLEQTSRDAVASIYRGADLGPLPDAEEELDRVQALYGPRTVVLKGADATEARTKTAVRGADVLHFATHALFDNTNPMYSRLALAHDKNAAEDGWLETWEIAQMDLPVDIVVLSACETARGRIGRGEGVVGMAWAFFVAGARSVVATQWKVVSVSASRFMVDFHRSLRANGNGTLRKAKALQSAQLHQLRNPLSSHPYYWAPFVLLGDPSSH